MNPIYYILKREFNGYFATPLAYVFIVIFLVLAGLLTFYMGNFYDRGQADLIPFFEWHPWLYLFLIPAISMRLWAEERRAFDDVTNFNTSCSFRKIFGSLVIYCIFSRAYISILVYCKLSRKS